LLAGTVAEVTASTEEPEVVADDDVLAVESAEAVADVTASVSPGFYPIMLFKRSISLCAIVFPALLTIKELPDFPTDIFLANSLNS